MGNWGVTAHESDYGLDLFAVLEERYLTACNFEHFHLLETAELLKKHITDEFARENEGCAQHYIDIFNDYTFPYRYAHAVMLIVECFAEYRRNGELSIRVYGADQEYHIINFYSSNEDLRTLWSELQAILDPKHSLYQAWYDSDYFDEWHEHMQMLCEVLVQAMSEGGDSHA